MTGMPNISGSRERAEKTRTTRRNHKAKGHDCPVRLRSCYRHPKWNVVASEGRWWVFAPQQCESATRLSTQSEAYAYAEGQARAEHLRAIENQAVTT